MELDELLQFADQTAQPVLQRLDRSVARVAVRRAVFVSPRRRKTVRRLKYCSVRALLFIYGRTSCAWCVPA